MTSSDILQFEEVAEDHPAMTCNCCGQIAHWPEMKVAEIFPYVGNEEACEFVMCSDHCLHAFMTHPTLDHFIMMNILSVAKKKEQELKVSYKIWADKLTESITNN